MIDALMAGLAAKHGVIVWESKDGIAILAPVGPAGKMDQGREVEQAGYWQEVHHYLDIGGFQFFPSILDKSHVLDFVGRTLGKLEEYARSQGTELIDTLEKILQINNLKLVAKQLYVHRQTVLFRSSGLRRCWGLAG